MLDFVIDNSLIIINLSLLLSIAFLTFTSKNKDIGFLVGGYLLAYMVMDFSFFGFLENYTMLTFDKYAVFYLMCFALTFIIFIYAVYLFDCGNNVAGLYCVWLIIALSFDGLLCITQMVETNILLFVYNVIQNISVYVDLFVVFIGMDHMIKRNHNGTRILIECVNNYLDDWRFIPIIYSGKGAKCKQKN